MRQFFLLLVAVGVILAMAAMACATSGGVPMAASASPATPTKVYSLVLQAQADGLAALETAQAQETRTSLESIAKATSDALALEQQATSQAHGAEATRMSLDAQATRQAANSMATATAGAMMATTTAEARLAQATSTAVQATRVSAGATATAESVQATATMQSALDNAELTRVAGAGIAAQATAQAIERESAIAESRQVMTTWAGYGVLFLLLAGVAFVIYMTLPAVVARIGAIQRDARGDPPVLVLAARGALGGITVLDLPKLWSGATVIDSQVSQPLLTSPAFQDSQSKRADFVNLAKGGRPRPVIATPRVGGPVASQAEPWREDRTGDDAQGVTWPQRVNLLDVFSDRTPSLNSLVIGAYPQPDGSLAVVGESLHKLMHILCCGASGWGKSTFLSSFVWQLAQCQEPVAVVAIDISGSEFNLLRGWDKLQFPVARSDMDAIATLNAVAGELARRRELFERFPQARNLARYNRMSGDDLAPWVILLDEGASLLSRKDTGDTLRDAIQTSRQYGIYCLLSSVSVNHKVLETQTRDQFSTRLAFRLPKSSMRIVLDETPPNEPARPGRAWARLAGREMIELQAPIIAEQDLVTALLPGGPVGELPDVAQAESDPREQRIIDLLETEPALSDSAVARAAFGYENSRVRDLVRESRTRTDGQSGRTD